MKTRIDKLNRLIYIPESTDYAPALGADDNYVTDAEKVNIGNLIDYANPISVTGAVTATIGKLHVCSGTSANYTVTLPAVSGNSGKSIAFIMSGALTKLVTLDGNASETINGSLTRIMHDNESCILYCDGAEWKKLAGLSIPMSANISLTSAQIIANATLTLCQCNNVIVDIGNMADAANYQIIVRRPGLYKVIGSGYFSPDPAATCPRNVIQVYKNGAYLFAAEMGAYHITSYATPIGIRMYNLVAGDYFKLYGYQDSGGNRVLDASGTFVQLEEYSQW